MSIKHPTAAQHINVALKVAVIPLLRDRGFRKHRLHFWRIDNQFAKIISFESASFHQPGPTATFTVLASVVDIELHQLLHDGAFPKNPASAIPCIRRYIDTMDADVNQWTVLSRNNDDVTDVGTDVAKAVNDHILPYLDALSDRDSLITEVRSHGHDWLGTRIGLLALGGELEESARLLRQFADQFVDHVDQTLHAERLAEAIDLSRRFELDMPIAT